MIPSFFSSWKGIFQRGNSVNIIDLAVQYAWSMLHGWYKWDGDDPSGRDCSGMIVEILQAVGKLPRSGDLSSRGLAAKFPKVDFPAAGCLVFWTGGGDKIEDIQHVEFCIDAVHTIGASGGGSKTLTVEDAIRDNAFIKMRPIERDRKRWGYVDPFKEDR